MSKALLAVLLAASAVASAQRLPDLAVPERYQITLAPDFSTDKFSGEETIAVRVLKPSPEIVLNAAEITFGETTIAQAGSTQPARVSLDAEKQTATLRVAQPLAPGAATIHIRYTGVLNNRLRGFYLSTINHGKYAFTQFENTDARRAFPAFDEPAMKATFELTAVIDKDTSAISNTKVVSDAPGPADGKHTVKFAPTPRMSSYLLALAVGAFECEEGASDGIPIRVCGTPDKKGWGQFALKAAEFTMHFYNQYFGIKYPYGKLDFIGAPDFAAGAMENTGCIIARDALLFIDPKNSSHETQLEVAQGAVAHEMAHQWFGDLVTMKWWDDVWLNEGFATWMSFKPVEAYRPQWNLATDRVQSATRAMATDSLQSTHPIQQRAETPEQIMELFDSITYQKTAAVLEMVEGYVGRDVFRKGINSYLQKYAYQNASAVDFWNEIARVSHKPVDRVMASFVQQPGVPVIAAADACANGNSRLTLRQQRYFSSPESFEHGGNNAWTVPACMKSGAAERCELLTAASQSATMRGCAPVLLNAGARGYYRSAYDPPGLSKMAAIAELQLSPPERMMLVSDAWAGVHVHQLSVGDYLALVSALKDDPTDALVDEFARRLRTVGEYIATDEDRETYAAWVRRSFSPPGEKLGWTPSANDSEQQRALRADYLNLAGYVGRDPQLLALSRNLTQQYLKGEAVDAALMNPAAAIAARSGDAALYDQVLQHAKRARTSEAYNRDLRMLAEFEDPALVQRTLQYAVSPDVRAQDVLYLFYPLMRNPAARDATWRFVQQHWDAVAPRLDNYSTGAVVGMTDTFCDAGNRDSVQRFFQEHRLGAAERALRLTVESINNCIDLRQRQSPNLSAWLRDHGSSTSAAGR
jgi:aminopeptidase N